MPATIRLISCFLALVGWAVAEVPRKAPISRYTSLWTSSPFTSKPPPPAEGPTVNPLEDYSLAGVSPVGTGYRVTLLNKKKPEERIVVDSNRDQGDFKILEVTRKAGDPLATVVRLSSSTGVTGTVSFDEKLLVLATPPAPKNQPKPGRPGAPGMPQPRPTMGGQPVNPASGSWPQRQPRPRVVPPPSPSVQPGTPGSSSSNPSSGRPVYRGGR